MHVNDDRCWGGWNACQVLASYLLPVMVAVVGAQSLKTRGCGCPDNWLILFSFDKSCRFCKQRDVMLFSPFSSFPDIIWGSLCPLLYMNIQPSRPKNCSESTDKKNHICYILTLPLWLIFLRLWQTSWCWLTWKVCVPVLGFITSPSLATLGCDPAVSWMTTASCREADPVTRGSPLRWCSLTIRHVAHFNWSGFLLHTASKRQLIRLSCCF